jgi:hypothetical protein
MILDVFVLVLEKSTEPTSIPILILLKILFEELSLYLNARYVSKAVTTLLASGVNFENR